jgi:hypothetical protein
MAETFFQKLEKDAMLGELQDTIYNAQAKAITEGMSIEYALAVTAMALGRLMHFSKNWYAFEYRLTDEEINRLVPPFLALGAAEMDEQMDAGGEEFQEKKREYFQRMQEIFGPIITPSKE